MPHPITSSPRLTRLRHKISQLRHKLLHHTPKDESYSSHEFKENDSILPDGGDNSTHKRRQQYIQEMYKSQWQLLHRLTSNSQVLNAPLHLTPRLHQILEAVDCAAKEDFDCENEKLWTKLCDVLSVNHISDRYHELQRIGKGGFSRVYACVDMEEHIDVAVKRVKTDKLQEVLQEVFVMLLMQQLGVPSVHLLDIHVKVDETDAEHRATLFIVTELMLTTARSYKGKFSEMGIAYIIKQILLVLVACHSLGIVHRDIKASNILLNEHGDVQLNDYGLIMVVPQWNLDKLVDSDRAGTKAHMAPELALGEPHCGVNSDIWSLGVTIIEMAGLLPPKSNTHTFLAQYRPDLKSGKWSNQMADFINQCLVWDYQHRPSAAQLLQHPWIQSIENFKPKDIDGFLAAAPPVDVPAPPPAAPFAPAPSC